MEQEIPIHARTRKIGGSLVVTIPAYIVKEKNLVEDQSVTITVDKKRIDGFGALRGIGSYTREDRMKDRDI